MLLPDEMCLTTREASDLGAWAADVYLWSVKAYRACSISEPGIERGVRTLP